MKERGRRKRRKRRRRRRSDMKRKRKKKKEKKKERRDESEKNENKREEDFNSYFNPRKKKIPLRSSVNFEEINGSIGVIIFGIHSFG